MRPEWTGSHLALSTVLPPFQRGAQTLEVDRSGSNHASICAKMSELVWEQGMNSSSTRVFGVQVKGVS